ncbi:MAG: hypothetical protein KGZ25_12515, partial [Planctomycetes bacterium]|nr:hypothetical protein [Planctomycetota bacterium]
MIQTTNTGQRRVTDQNGTRIVNTYDELNRLVRRDIQRAAGVAGTTLELYRYDALGRLRADF